MKTLFRISFISIILAHINSTQPTFAQGTSSLDFNSLALETQIKLEKEITSESARIKNFEEQNKNLSGQLQDLIKNQTLLEREIEGLDKEHTKNQQILRNFESKIDNKIGALKNVYLTFKNILDEIKTEIDTTFLLVEHPNRQKEILDLSIKLNLPQALPNLTEMRNFIDELNKQLRESGTTSQFTTEVTNSSGEIVKGEVIRIGSFNVISKDGYLNFKKNTRAFSLYERQPPSTFVSLAKRYYDPNDSNMLIPIDPSGGELLKILTLKPTLIERIKQGGAPGYLIIILGAASIILCLLLYADLWRIDNEGTTKFRNSPSSENKIANELTFISQNSDYPKEMVELKLTEVISKENQRLCIKLNYIKFIAVVAPLLGLLGTVAGMIETFQAISLFGSSDPKLMASGISKALVTTVLGLCVAIPSLLFNTYLAVKIKSLVERSESFATQLLEKHQ